MSQAANPRQFVLRFIFIGVAAIMLLRLLFLQVFEDKYKVMAAGIAIYRKIVYPPRGIIYDRKGKVMVYNKGIYDLMVTPNNIPKNFDTVQFCSALGIDKETYIKLLGRVRIKSGLMRQSAFIEELSSAQTARFQENIFLFTGFELVERGIRTYPNASAGIVLGYTGEISPEMLKKDRYVSYQQGDYVGMNGLESSYEEVLRGQRGVHFLERDNLNRPRDPYMGGKLDTPEISGHSLHLYLDADLEAYAEKLLQNKIGSVVAIEPQTGGILAMVSSPTYDPNLLQGRERARNYAALARNPAHPLFNRAIQASYQPGSTIKPMTGIVALDLGVITPAYGYPCLGHYYSCGRPIACDEHTPGHAANFRLALAHSCNSYFCNVFRMTIDDPKFHSVKRGLQVWHDYFNSFGYGHPTGVDIPYEGKGLLPDSTFYNKRYNGVWNSCTVVFVGMGQGELALTPLQMANGMCIIANKGYYYTPHFVRAIDNNTQASELKPYLKKHEVTHIADTTYTIIQNAMQDVVDNGTARAAKLDGVDICAKTGTVENKAIVDGKVIKMKNHSMFVAFAPKEHPRIAIAVAIENAGYGAAWAAPIASLLIEKYLKDTISASRKPLEEKMMKANLVNQYIYTIDSIQRIHDAQIYADRMEKRRIEDSTDYADDSFMVHNWILKQTGKKSKK